MKYQIITAISVCVAAALSSTASAQNGTLDQESPAVNAGFNLTTSSLTWQAQVRAGVDGQLEGIAMLLTGTPGVSQAEVSIGLGDAWSTNIVFTELVTLQIDGNWQFIDTTSANIQLSAGDTFVIQTNGNDTGMGCSGSYVAPPGDPLYPEPLWLNEESFSNGGWRHGFRSYMVAGSPDCLTLTVNNLVGGSNGTWDVSGATPNTEVAVVYGFQDGLTSINGFAQYCADFGINGVNSNRVLCRKTADAAGNISCRKTIPQSSSGVRLLSQAAERNTCPETCMSNIDDQIIG